MTARAGAGASDRPGLTVLLLSVFACGPIQRAIAPVPPHAGDTPAVGQIPDSILTRLIENGDLIVLGTPVALASEHGILSPSFQFGARETWYDVKLVVDSVAKGKLKHAKWVDYGVMPALFRPPTPFGRLGANEIIVQYPAVTSSQSNWASAQPPIEGQRAVFIFRKCWNCLPITGVAHGRGPYYTANPWVALGWGSKLEPAEWARVSRLLRQAKQRSPRRKSDVAHRRSLIQPQ